MNTTYKLILAGISITVGILLPFLLYWLGGGLRISFSDYHNTEARHYLFAFLLLMAGGFFTGEHTYKLSGILLIVIAFVNIDYLLVHNIVAAVFFAYTTVLMLKDKRFYYLAFPIILTALTIPFKGLYFFEVITVWQIAAFNGLYMLRYLRLIKIR